MRVERPDATATGQVDHCRQHALQGQERLAAIRLALVCTACDTDGEIAKGAIKNGQYHCNIDLQQAVINLSSCKITWAIF
jgi:hypothetical protein